MLFQRRFHDGIRSGSIRCTVRIWQSPRVKVGHHAGERVSVIEFHYDAEARARAKPARPGVLAAKLASSLGRSRDEFKRDVRKLKALELTSILEVGYRLTPKARSLRASLAGGSLS